jgi:hypothetical protein
MMASMEPINSSNIYAVKYQIVVLLRYSAIMYLHIVQRISHIR